MKTYDEVASNVLEGVRVHRHKMHRVQQIVSAGAMCTVCVLGTTVYMNLEKLQQSPPEMTLETYTETVSMIPTMNAASETSQQDTLSSEPAPVLPEETSVPELAVQSASSVASFPAESHLTTLTDPSEGAAWAEDADQPAETRTTTHTSTVTAVKQTSTAAHTTASPATTKASAATQTTAAQTTAEPVTTTEPAEETYIESYIETHIETYIETYIITEPSETAATEEMTEEATVEVTEPLSTLVKEDATEAPQEAFTDIPTDETACHTETIEMPLTEPEMTETEPSPMTLDELKAAYPELNLTEEEWQLLYLLYIASDQPFSFWYAYLYPGAV